MNSSTTNDCLVAFTIEGSYWPHAASAIASTLDHTHGITFLIVHDLPDAQWMRRITKYANKLGSEVLYRRFDNNLIRDMRIYSHAGYSTYYKMFLPKIVDESYKKVLYLDADLIVLDDVKKLFAISMNSKAVAARKIFGTAELSELNRKLNRPACTPYCNTGVYLIDAEMWRSQNLTEKSANALLNMPSMITHSEQCAINFAIGGEFAKMPLEWNVTELYFNQGFADDLADGVTVEEVMHARDNPSIIHFNGPTKPWHSKNKHPWKSSYGAYRRKIGSPFYISDDLKWQIKQRILRVLKLV